MNPQKTGAKDFFLNLGAIVALYTVTIYLVNLLFTVIGTAYPQINNYYYSSPSISWPVAVIIIFFPIYVLLVWLLEKGYKVEPEKRKFAVRRWLTYITLFVAGLAMAIDLVTVLYYFIDGQELTTAFLLKIVAVLVVALIVFLYYISDIREKLNGKSRKIWLGVALVTLLGSIIWGFSILGSPATQRAYKYDEQKISDLQNINYQIQNYYQTKGSVPSSLDDVANVQYSTIPKDSQTGVPYEYHLIGQSAKAYQLCAVFNKASPEIGSNYARPVGEISWTHPAGHYCFSLAIPLNQYVPPGKLPM